MNPDPNGMHVIVDGERWYSWGVTYDFRGSEWGGPQICARTREEAEARLDAMSRNGRVDQTIAIVPSHGGLGGLRSRAATWLLNHGISPHHAWAALCFALIILLWLK